MTLKGRTCVIVRPHTCAWTDHSPTILPPSLTNLILPHHGKPNHGLARSNRSPALRAAEILGPLPPLSYWKWVTITMECPCTPCESPPLPISVHLTGQLEQSCTLESQTVGAPHIVVL